MNTGNGSIKTLLSSRGDFQGSGMRACWQNTAGHWYDKLLLHGTRGRQTPHEGDTMSPTLYYNHSMISFFFNDLLQMTRVTPELEPLSSNVRTSPTRGRLTHDVGFIVHLSHKHEGSFNGNGFRIWNPPVPKSRPYYQDTNVIL
ncbi:hypothetical protein AVEN_72822-1 [Araneus ventricosus]|uniref:Uncharacterized protein n=1 Tax=Araneus ventricosus TaxID=182803 RepID=A0A4Y2F9I4_ARAVE|nr:hypothetical protein AVEN_72822-1 [Araneus ventricosus]